MGIQTIYLPQDQRTKTLGDAIDAVGNSYAAYRTKQEQDAKSNAVRAIFANLMPDGSPEKAAIMDPNNNMQPQETANLISALAQARTAQMGGKGFATVPVIDAKGNRVNMQIPKIDMTPENLKQTGESLHSKGFTFADPNIKTHTPTDTDKKVYNTAQQWATDPNMKGVKKAELNRRSRTLVQSQGNIDGRLKAAFGKQFGDKFDFEGLNGDRYDLANKLVRTNIMVKGMKPQDAISSAITEAKNQIQDTPDQTPTKQTNNDSGGISGWIHDIASHFTGSDNNQNTDTKAAPAATPAADTNNKDNTDMIDIAPVNGKMIQIPKALTQNATRADVKNYLTKNQNMSPEEADNFIKEHFQ